MKNQALFSSEDKSKKLKCRLPQFLFGALRVNRGDHISRFDCISQDMELQIPLYYFGKCIRVTVIFSDSWSYLGVLFSKRKVQ